MNASQLAKILAVIGTIAGLVATQQDLVSSKYVPFIALLALTCTASVKVFNKFAGNWAVTGIGAGLAIIGAATPYLAGLQANWAHSAMRWTSFLGIALAVVGKGFFGVEPDSNGQES